MGPLRCGRWIGVFIPLSSTVFYCQLPSPYAALALHVAQETEHLRHWRARDPNDELHIESALVCQIWRAHIETPTIHDHRLDVHGAVRRSASDQVDLGPSLMEPEETGALMHQRPFLEIVLVHADVQVEGRRAPRAAVQANRSYLGGRRHTKGDPHEQQSVCLSSARAHTLPCLRKPQRPRRQGDQLVPARAVALAVAPARSARKRHWDDRRSFRGRSPGGRTCSETCSGAPCTLHSRRESGSLGLDTCARAGMAQASRRPPRHRKAPGILARTKNGCKSKQNPLTLGFKWRQNSHKPGQNWDD